jgi:tetratricopeptide (TPR) repeat protein
MPGIDRRSHALYQHVMTMVYRFADIQLGRLIELAGKHATVIVCSPHGFRCGADRPKPTNHQRSNVNWHRTLGVLAMRGPAIRRDHWCWGGTVLDICPTILALFGLSKGDELDGRPLEEVFEAIPTQRQESDTSTISRDAQFAGVIDEDETNIVLQSLVDDGYLKPGTHVTAYTVQRALDARAFNLAQVHLHSGCVAKAAESLEALVDRRPQVGRFALQLAQCRLALGDRRGCEQLIVKLNKLDVPIHYVRCLNAGVHLADKNYTQALDELFDVEQANPRLPGIHRQIGDVYLATHCWDEARRAYQKEIERDADDPAALFGLGCVAEADSDYAQAVDCFVQAVAIQRFHPAAHFALARVFDKLDRVGDAIASVERCLAQRPNFQEAQTLLANLRCRVAPQTV